MSDPGLYNTHVSVVANLPAESETDAIARLAAILEAHGFTTITEDPAFCGSTVAEDGTEPSEIRASCHSFRRVTRYKVRMGLST